MPRQCGNCYWNPSGQVCQLEPMSVTETKTKKIVPGALLGAAAKTEDVVERNTVPRFTPPHYVCSHHSFAREMPEWSLDDEP